MGRAKRKVFRPIFGKDLSSSAGRRSQEQVDNSFRAAQLQYEINAEKYRASAIRNLGESLEGLNEAEKQILIDKAIADIMPKEENPFADISSNPDAVGAIQADEERFKAGSQVDYGLLDKAEVWMNASMNKLLANATQSIKAGSDVIRGASDYFFSGNDVSPNYMLSEAVEREGKGALYNIFGAGNKYLAETAESADRAIHGAEASLASRGMDSGFWHAASDMVGQWGFTYGGMGTAALGRLAGGTFSVFGKIAKSASTATRWAKASEYTRKLFSAGSHLYGALSEAAVESYGVSKALEEAKGSQLAQLRSMMQKDFDQDFYSYERKYGAIKFSDFADNILTSSGMDPRLKREVANVLSGKSENASPNAIAAANAIVSQYKDQAEKAILQNASDEIDQRNGLASGWTAGLNTFILTFMNKYSYELATDKLAGANRLKKAGRFGVLGSTLINATSEGIEEVVQGGISKGAESLGKRAVDEMLRASTISERNSTSIGVLGSLGEIGKGVWDTTFSASPWVDEALPAIVSTLLIPMYKGSKMVGSRDMVNERTDAFGDPRGEKKSWLSKLYDSSPIGFAGVERYRDYKYSGGKQRTSDEAIEAMSKIIKGKHDDLTKEEKRVMTEVFGQNYAETVHETYQSVVDAMASADRMNTLLEKVAQSTSDSTDVAVAEELAKAHNVATMLSVIGNSSIGLANFNKRNFGQWTSDLMRSTREFGADMGHAISSLFGANTEEKEARYQAAVAKREADKAAREEARRSESDPFSEVPDNLRPFLNFLDVKETDEATLVSIARQRIENTLDSEERQKMQEAYFQGEGSDKLTEKAIKDIAGEINKQKHTLADIAVDYTNTMRYLDLGTKAGELSGREKSRIAAAAASFNHLRRLSLEHMDAFEEEVAGLYKEASQSLEKRITELIKDREDMRSNLNTDDEKRKSRLEDYIDQTNKAIEELEKQMRALEEAQKKYEESKKGDFSHALGGWDEFTQRFDSFSKLNEAHIDAAFMAGNDELGTKLAEMTLVDEKKSENGKLALSFARQAMQGVEALDKMLEGKNNTDILVARAAEEEKRQAEQDAADAVRNGEPKEDVDRALDSAESNGLEGDEVDVAKAAAAKAAEGEGSELSRYRSSVRNAIKNTLKGNEDFMGILRSFELDSDAIDKFIDDLISMVNDVVDVDPNGGYTDYKEAMTDALNLLTDRQNNPDLANQIFGLNNDDLISAVAEWIKGNIDEFPQDPTTPAQTLQGKPSKPNGERIVDSIEFDQATQHDIESASIGGVTVLNYSMSQRLQELFHGKNAIVNLLSKGSATINTSITFADGKATINVSISAGSETYEFSFSLGYDDLRNRLQMGVSLSTLIGDIVNTMVKVNERNIRKAFEAAGKDYAKKKNEAKKSAVGNQNSGEKNNEGRPSDTKPKVHEGPVPGSTEPTSPATDPTDDDGSKPSLPHTGRLTLWDQYNPGLNEANLTSLSEEWQEKIRKWYEEKNVGLNLKNAKGKEVFYGFAEELSENGDVSNSPIVVYVKDEQDQFVPIGLLPDHTTGNTQVLIDNIRAVATEDKKFDIFSSSDLNAPKAAISKVKYSPFKAKRVRGDKTIDAETIENGIEEELKRGQVAISVTAFPNGDNPPTIKSTTHDKDLDSETAEVIDAFIKEKESFLAQNYGQTYLVVLVNGKDGPKPTLVGIKGRDLIVDLVQGTAEDSEVSDLADEYMDKLTEEFKKAMETPDGEASGVYGEKYSSVFGSSFVYSVKPLRDADGNVTQVEITFPKRLNEGNIQSSAPVVVDIDLSSGDTIQALANAIVDAMKSSGKEKRRTAIAESIMGNKEKVEDVMTSGMRMTEVRDEAGFEALSEEKGGEEGNKTTPEPTTPPQGPEGTKTMPRVSTAAASNEGNGDGSFGSAGQDSLEKIKDDFAKNLVDKGYSVVVKSSTSPHIAAVDNGRIYMFEINPVDGTYNKVEWSAMHPTLKADAFALINSALSSDFKSSKNGRLLEYGEEMGGSTHTITVRRSTKGMSTGGKKKSSGSNADRIVRLAKEEKHVAAHAIKTEPTLRGLVLELAAKGVSSGTPIYFSEHTINGKTYGGGHKVILQAEDEHGNVHSVEVEIDNELGAKMDKIAEDVRELSVKKVSEGFAMISDVKMKDLNRDVITGEADIIFLRNDGEKGEGIVADIKSTLIASEDSSPAEAIRRSQHDGVYATTKYKAQIDGYETHIKSLGFKIAEQGYVIAVGYATSNGATVVEAMSLDEKDLNRHRKTLNRGTKTGRNGLNPNDEVEADPYEEREALLPFERGDVYKEAHDVAKLLPQGLLYQAIRIHQGIAEVTPGVWGRYRNGIIEVASGASAGTLYHEAMHFIYEKLLTDADRGMLVSGLSEVTEEQIREIFGNQIPIAYARDVRELSAELFRLWMQTKGDKKARKALEEKITKLAPKKKGFWGRLQALWERIKAALGYTPTSSVVSVLTGIEGGNYSHVSVASRVNATNLSSPMEGVVESMLRYGLMSEEEFNSSYDPSSIMASRNLAQLIHKKLMELAYEALSDLEGDKIETSHAGSIRRREGDIDDAIAVLRDAASTSEKAKHTVEIIDELGIDSQTKTVQEMDALEERTDNLLGQTLAGCR
jgi:hypothetical protein|nr:MAG TPA: hypothetical protein [Crassvirales sp.]